MILCFGPTFRCTRLLWLAMFLTPEHRMLNSGLLPKDLKTSAKMSAAIGISSVISRDATANLPKE